jgi:omega-6 fatty acid desaturase (delta-12 desaturase)
VQNRSAGLSQLRKALVAYQKPNVLRSAVEILLSAAPLAAIWVAAWFAAGAGLWWAALLLAVPAAFFVVRLFMIQHDCGHRSLFKSGSLNDWLGRALGVLTLTPYDCWKHEHAIHHATSGNLDRRGAGSLVTLTVAEYAALSPLRRLGYRLYRHPLVLFVVGPFFVFFLQQRLPVGLMKHGWRPWVSAMGTNVAIALLAGATLMVGGWQSLLFFHLPAVLIAASIGVWLFFVQHQFEETHWARHAEWDAAEAAVKGSSHYDLPAPLRWLTGNIGIHHVHHLASRIPFYRLPKVLKHYPDLTGTSRISFFDSLRCVRLALWDEAERRLVSFRRARLASQAAAAA